MGRQPMIVKPDNYRLVLTAGDISATTFSQLSAFLNEIAYSVLHNSKNHSAWPGAVSNDISQQVNALLGRVDVSEGLVAGKTVLSMPVESRGMAENEFDEAEEDDYQMMQRRGSSASQSRSTSASAVDNSFSKHIHQHRALIHAIESVVIQWAHQIQSVVEQDSSDPLLSGSNPWSHHELDFWKEKAKNLQHICDQLNQPKIGNMARLLQNSGRSYWSTLKKLFEDVRLSLAEASDISTHLNTLRNLVESMEQGSIAELKPYLTAFMHVFELIWKHSQHYKSASRVIILLQEVNNMMIDHVGID